MNEHKHNGAEHKSHHNHPMSEVELREKAARRAERVREGRHGDCHGHCHLDVPVRERPQVHAPHYDDEGKAAIFDLLGHMSCEEVWGQFWHQAAEEKSGDPPGPARDHLIRHYGMYGFLAERYAREQKHTPKGLRK